MFTPPPSPQPSNSKQLSTPSTDTSSSTLSPPSFPNAMSSHDQKRQTGRRFKWAVLIVPAVLVLITASTHYLAHPGIFDIFSSPSTDFSRVFTSDNHWRLHKRHPFPQPDSSPSPSLAVSGPAASSPPSPTISTQPIPTLPGPPPTLPTPFPQPYDPQLTLNFSSVSCLSFFTNMTQSTAFRTCRPFSLLSGTSATFINVSLICHEMSPMVWNSISSKPFHHKGSVKSNTYEHPDLGHMQYQHWDQSVRSQHGMVLFHAEDCLCRRFEGQKYTRC